MRLTNRRLKKLIREEYYKYVVEDDKVMDFVEDEITNYFDDYSVSRSEGQLIVDDGDGIFRIALKNAMDVKPTVEVTYSDPEDTGYARRKKYYLHQLDQIKYHLKSRQF